MAEKDKASQAAVAISVGAAIAAAWALLGKRALAAPLEGGIVSLDEATMQLIIAIAQASGNIDSNILQALVKLQAIIDKPGAGAGQGWPTNAQGTRTFAVACVLANQAYPVPDMTVPDGMALLIKSSPLNALGSFVRVAKTPAECTNPNSSWPLILNESISYFVKNADAFHISSNVAGSIALFSAEQRS